MSLLFNRFIAVEILQYSFLNGQKVFNPNQRLVVNDLRVTFKVQKTWMPTPNNGTIEIYNLSPESRAFISAKQAYVTLYAGYDDIFKAIFFGDVAFVTTKRQGPDIITSLDCGDGQFFYGKKSVSKSYKPGSSWGQIFNDLAGEFGFPVGQVKGANLGQQYAQGFTVSGLIRDGMNTLMGRQGLEWSVQDNKVYVLPEKTPTDHDAIVLNADSGLVGSPFSKRLLRQDQAKKQNGQVAESGVNLVSLLNGEIFPGRQIQVQSEFATGAYKVRTVLHEGDTEGGNWYSSVEAV